MPMANRLILDTDGGVDDAQALLLLIAAGRAPDAITTVYGNVSLEAATDNVLAILAAAGAHIEVHAGAAQPLVETRIDARHVHGEDGLGGAPRPAETRDLAGADAVQFLTATLTAAAAADDRVDLLMVGPLTNLALALRRTPGIVGGIGQLTVMGGTLYGRGNVTPAAEFNIFCDPEAAAIVLGAGLDTTIVPWEPCVGHFLEGSDIDRMLEAAPDSDYKAFVRALMEHDRSRHVREGKGDRLFLIDPLASGGRGGTLHRHQGGAGVGRRVPRARHHAGHDRRRPVGPARHPAGHPGRGGTAGPSCGAGRGVPHLDAAEGIIFPMAAVQAIFFSLGTK